MFIFVFLQVGFSYGYANEEIIWEGTAKSFFSNYDLTITSKGIYKNRKFTNIHSLSDQEICTFGLTNFPNTTKIYYPKENNLWKKKILQRNISFSDCVNHSISYRNSFVFKENFIYLSDTPNDIICDKATGLDFNNNKLIWTKDYDLKNFVIEAKHRGLNCGVTENNKTVTASNKRKGKLISYSGREYIGIFKDGVFKGTNSDGSEYIGEYENGTMNGRGTFIGGNDSKFKGNKYIGEFKDGNMHGQGTLNLGDGTKYMGEFKDGKFHGGGTFIWADGKKDVGEFENDKLNGFAIRYDKNGNILKRGMWKNDIFLKSEINDKQSKNTKISSTELDKEKQKRIALQKKADKEERKRKALEQRIAELEKKNKELQQPNQIKQKTSNEIGSGFYVSKFRHIVTNQHVVNKCKKITVGDSMTSQIPADLIASDKRNDLAILQTISMDMASVETKSFIQNLSIQIVPIVSGGLIRIEDVKGGEQVYVAGFPHGNMISDSMRLVPGLVNSTRGFENDITQFETDAVIRKGNSGGPVYDSKGNIVGIAVKRFNVTRSDNYNFAIKGSTVKQFLDAHNILTTPANRTSSMTSTKIYKIASKQTVMVVCHR